MINSKTIENAIYELCVSANTNLSGFEEILQAYQIEGNQEKKQNLGLILKNAQIAFDKKEPLCQDTGQVLVFLKIGQNVQIEGDLITTSINKGIKKAYEDNFYRKSVVKDALDRINTKDNTPAIIYTEIIAGNKIEINLLIKGAGAENMSEFKMLSPTASEDEIAGFVIDVVEKSGTNACPPLFVGIGIGGTLEYAGLLSKKALIEGQSNNLTEKIKQKSDKILDIKILTAATHIACMPIAVTLNCHSSRHAKCEIIENKVKFFKKDLTPELSIEADNYSDYKKINTEEIEKIKSLKKDEKILLSGEIFTARDAAHKRLVEMIKNKEPLPLDLENKIIFYAGPCPCDSSKIIGSIGPTTASRMDKFASILYENGVIATIGKGERSKDIGGIYLSMLGGVACYIAQKVTKNEMIAFEELGAEAIYKLEVNDLPLRVE